MSRENVEKGIIDGVVAVIGEDPGDGPFKLTQEKYQEAMTRLLSVNVSVLLSLHQGDMRKDVHDVAISLASQTLRDLAKAGEEG